MTVGMNIGMLNGQLRVKAVDAERRAVSAVLSTGSVDRYGEIIEPKAFEKRLPRFAENPVLLADHDHTRQIGHWENVRVTARGLEGDAIFAETELAEEHFQLYAGGHRKAFSVGFIAHDAKTENREVDGQTRKVRVFTDVELVECSSVAIPANTEALVTLGFDDLQRKAQPPEPPEDSTREAEPGHNASWTGVLAKAIAGEIHQANQQLIEELADQMPRMLADAADLKAGRDVQRSIMEDVGGDPEVSEDTRRLLDDLNQRLAAG